ncbi:HPr family phosphocarrier protein [Maridesulfovibrio hydrothermalis]|uniref:Phosphocarrier protein HPr n=1 Tax=Maridesulfovibrio hydrothermalis AM13 = DSM 14728 TaxID=1121451 RepID=L0R7R7_9BACT|nr:HPr family phosphocarrier protein [Maridesulfovibrio hydrothermalis]CCO22784.1 Phosphocarrier protein HPr [Maridesulfovibrio hydrothermalis AM13 = DSM 14728]
MIDNSELRDEAPSGDSAARTVVVANQLGLHARPAARLAQEAQNFEAAITIVSESQEVDAKSILDILTLAAAQGSALELRAEGADAAPALDCLEELFKNRFGEEK